MPEIQKGYDGLNASLKDLVRRDQEVSDKLKASFAPIKTQLADVALKSSSVESMQTGIHSAVAKQEQDLASAKIEIERIVTGALQSIAALTQQHSEGSPPEEQREGSGGRGSPRLSNPKKTEVEQLSDAMSKASFVLWRDNLDMHLESFTGICLGSIEVLTQRCGFTRPSSSERR